MSLINIKYFYEGGNNMKIKKLVKPVKSVNKSVVLYGEANIICACKK